MCLRISGKGGGGTYQSKKPPTIAPVQEKVLLSLLFRYSTTVSLALKTGTNLTTSGFDVSLPNSLGRNRLTPALIAASMARLIFSTSSGLMVRTIASWPLNAARSSSSG